MNAGRLIQFANDLDAKIASSVNTTTVLPRIVQSIGAEVLKSTSERQHMNSNAKHVNAVLMALALCTIPLISQAADAEQLVDGLNAVFGKQTQGVRASHAKGQCVKGIWEPTPQSAELTHSASFAKEYPVLARFSVGGGNPAIADTTKSVVRGLSLRIDPNGSAQTEFVMVNAPVHFARTLDQMLEFLKVRVPGPEGKPDAEKIRAFGDANPETKRQGAFVSAKQLPASYAGVNYWAVHAYTMTNASGKKRTVKFKFVPQMGELGLSDDEAKVKPADFLVDELRKRLTVQPVKFDVLALLGQPGDISSDPSQTWRDEEKRASVKVATLTITEFEDNAICNARFFNPTNLAAGVSGPADDPFFAIRLPSYAISHGRRSN